MDFLKSRTEDAIKRELRSILDSYHHYWDPLSELIQNSRDAIDRAQREGLAGPFFIRVKVDAASRTIEILDNGVGIPEDKIIEVLSPGGGDKSDRDKEVGEKGVGLTYTIFCGGKFKIESRTVDGNHYGGKVLNARSWLDNNGQSDNPPRYENIDTSELSLPDDKLELEGFTFPLKSFTQIRIESIQPSGEPQDLFSLNARQLKFLLTTRTAIGVTTNLFDDNYLPAFKVFYDINMGTESRGTGELGARYTRPHEYVSKVKSFDEVTSAFVSKTTDKKRRKYLKDTAVWARQETTIGSDTIRVYGVMMPGNSVFSKLSTGALKLEDPESTSGDDEDALFRSGIFLGTKKMPTGVEIPHGTGGKYPAYYKRCFFLVESDNIKFDLGRKSMHWQPKRRLQNAVSELFIKFESLAPFQSDERVPASATAMPVETKAERDARKKQEWERYRGLVDLRLPQIAFEKIPAGQEAGVAAIFHELLGAKLLKYYRPLTTGYSAQYDLHVLYAAPNSSHELELIIEFKYTLESLVKDLEDGRKYMDDIHMLVAWKADAQKLKDAGIDLDVCENEIYDGVTHEVTLPGLGIDPIPVIILDDLIKKFRAI